jgi:hypothetical protein
MHCVKEYGEVEIWRDAVLTSAQKEVSGLSHVPTALPSGKELR